MRYNFSADIFLAGFFSTHQTFRGGNDINSVTAEHARNFGRADVDAAARARDALQMRDRRSALRIVTQENADREFDAFALGDEVIDVSFFFQNTRYFQFQF